MGSEIYIAQHPLGLVVVDPYLCYLSMTKNKSKEPMWERVKVLFSEEEILQGKKILCEITEKTFVDHRGGTKNPAIKLNHEDAMAMWNGIDFDGEKKYVFAVGADKVNRVPRATPEEASLEAVAERVKDMQANLSSVLENVELM